MNILIVGDDISWQVRLKEVLWLLFPGAFIFAERRHKDAVALARAAPLHLVVLGPCFMGPRGVLHHGANAELYRALSYRTELLFLFWSASEVERNALKRLFGHNPRVLGFLSDTALPGYPPLLRHSG